MTCDVAAIQPVFADQGYYVIKDLLEPEVVESARAAINLLVDRCADALVAAGKIPDRLEDVPFETRLMRLYDERADESPKSFRPELHLAELFDLFFHPGLLDIVEGLLGPEVRLYPVYTARPKFPDAERHLVLWHQDGGYTSKTNEGVNELRMVNVWSPLVPADEVNGCMQFVPGTHKLGVVPHEGREHYLEIPEAILGRHRPQAVSIPLNPGDVVLFHNLLFHQGLPNRSQGIRWSLDWRYQDATQDTLRPEHGHLARSRLHPDEVVKDRADWAARSFT